MKLNIFKRGTLILLLIWTCACSTTKYLDNNTVIENPKKEDLKKYLNNKVSFLGKTVNMKIGAVLVLENGQRIWMDEMDSWPKGFYVHDIHEKSKTVIVTGVLIERNDLPVFVQNKNESIFRQGIHVQEGTNLEEARHRYLLKDYKWKEVK